MRWRGIGLVLVAGVAVAATLLVVNGTRDDVASQSSSPDGTATSAAPSGNAKGTSPNGVTNGEGSEVIRIPDGTAKKGLPGLSRTKPATQAALITRPLPKTASSRGRVVAGFPTAVVGVVPNSIVRSSGISSTDSTLQVSIVADNAKSPGGIIAFYRKALGAQGFAESSAPATGGSTASHFVRGADRLVVTTTPGAKETSYSVFGTLHASARG